MIGTKSLRALVRSKNLIEQIKSVRSLQAALLFLILLEFCQPLIAQPTDRIPFTGQSRFIERGDEQKSAASISRNYFAKSLMFESLGQTNQFFIQNRGQMKAPIQYYWRNSKGAAAFFTDKEIYFVFTEKSQRNIIRMFLQKSNQKMKVVAEKPQRMRINFLIGNKPEKWQSNVLTFSEIIYRNIYPSIDLKFYFNEKSELEYDFILHSGGVASQIEVGLEGIERIQMDRGGNIALILGNGHQLTHHRPQSFEVTSGRQVSTSYIVRKGISNFNNLAWFYSFRIGEYDQSGSLVIDPVLSYSTYLGGSNYDDAWDITVDQEGFIYVTGQTYSTDFPITPGSFDSSCGKAPDFCDFAGDVFLTKISPDGSTLLYSTFVGGSDTELGRSIKVDANGFIYVMGTTGSDDFPLQNPIQSNRIGSIDVFVFGLTPDGSGLKYSTYFGGSDYDDPHDLAVTPQGTAVIGGATDSYNFPIFNAVQSQHNGVYRDGFLFSINTQGSLVFSTYLGGSQWDEITGVALDQDGNPYVCGWTESPDFPITSGSLDSNCGTDGLCNESGDGFISQLNGNGLTLLYSTYIGGGNGFDELSGIAVGTDSSVYVAGATLSNDYPLLNPFQNIQASNTFDGTLSKLSADLSTLIYSTYFGGVDWDIPYSVAVDETGSAYVTGFTFSNDFPLQNDLQSCSYYDVFITKFSPEGSALAYSTCLGGSSREEAWSIALDSGSSAYVTGYTRSLDFPIINPLQQFHAGGLNDTFVSKISFNYMLFDDFEDGILDWQISSGQWTEANGNLTASRKGMIFAPTPWSPSGASTCDSCTIETEMQSSGGDYGKVFLIGWYQNKMNRVTLLMDEANDMWILKQYVGGKIVSKGKHKKTISANTSYKVKLSTDGNVFRVYVDGQLVIKKPARASGLAGNGGFRIKHTTAIFEKMEIY